MLSNKVESVSNSDQVKFAEKITTVPGYLHLMYGRSIRIIPVTFRHGKTVDRNYNDILESRRSIWWDTGRKKQLYSKANLGTSRERKLNWVNGIWFR